MTQPVDPSGPDGLDCSPRGDPAGFVRVSDDGTTLGIPDRRGNNRLDSLRNIVEDGRIALLFLDMRKKPSEEVVSSQA